VKAAGRNQKEYEDGRADGQMTIAVSIGERAYKRRRRHEHESLTAPN